MQQLRPHSSLVTLAKVAFIATALVSTGCSAVLDWDSCTTDADCGAGRTCDTANGICLGGTITVAGLLKNNCQRVYGVPLENALDDNVILLGTLLPKNGQLAQYGGPMDDAVAMAVGEINSAGGLFGKKLAVLSCDSGTDSAQAKVAAAHLVNVGVPAVIGPAASGVSIDVFNDVFRAAGILSISPSATAPAISDLADDNLLWRTCPSDAFQGAAMAGYLNNSGAAKVALINRDDAYGNGLAQAVKDGVCAPAGPMDCNDDSLFFTRRYNAEAYSSPQSNIMLALAAFEPDVTVLVGFVEDGANFLNLAAQTTISRRFIVTDGMKSSDLITLVNEPELVCRLLGTQPAAPSGSNYQSFEINYGASYGGLQPGAFSANAYDALYALGYAMAAAGDTINGQTIAAGLSRLSTGTAVDVGQPGWGANIQKLSSSPTATIDFRGASGPLNFTANGEAPASIELWSFDLDKSETWSIGEIYSAEGEYEAPTGVDLAAPGIGAACAPFN